MCTASAVSTLELVHIVTFALHLSPCNPNGEHLTGNQEVMGSIPVRTQNYNT